MGALTRESFAARARAAAPVVPVELKGIGPVLVLQMSQADLEEHFEERRRDLPDTEAMRAMRRWISRLVVDEDRKPLFSGADDELLRASLTAPQLLDVGSAVIAAAIGTHDEEEEPDEGKGPATSGGSG